MNYTEMEAKVGIGALYNPSNLLKTKSRSEKPPIMSHGVLHPR